ncbi:MAG: hypothetical protein IJL69_00770, partial [Oscillospiraceae bacterium]|nr:hypothetical protein [Oscillospiraceae bacterium]
TFRMPAGNEFVEYYGHGPFEAYVDRDRSSKVGRYVSTVTDQWEHYVMPQECSSHYGTLWATVADETGHGLLFAPRGENGRLCFKAIHFDDKQIETTPCDWQLTPLAETVVSLDYRYTALAPDGRRAARDPEHLLDEKTLSFGFRILPVRTGAVDPFKAARAL